MSKEKLGKKLRRLREEHKLPLRKVAALLDIDVAILSKMERGERKLNKEVVLKLAEIYHHDPDELVIMYLSEKILYEIGDEELALKGLLAAEEEVRYRSRFRRGRQQTARWWRWPGQEGIYACSIAPRKIEDRGWSRQHVCESRAAATSHARRRRRHAQHHEVPRRSQRRARRHPRDAGCWRRVGSVPMGGPW